VIFWIYSIDLPLFVVPLVVLNFQTLILGQFSWNETVCFNQDKLHPCAKMDWKALKLWY